MKYLLTALVALLLATPAIAHPGHDHQAVVGGEWHHVWWLAGGVVIAFVVYRLFTRKRKAVPTRD